MGCVRRLQTWKYLRKAPPLQSWFTRISLEIGFYFDHHWPVTTFSFHVSSPTDSTEQPRCHISAWPHHPLSPSPFIKFCVWTVQRPTALNENRGLEASRKVQNWSRCLDTSCPSSSCPLTAALSLMVSLSSEDAQVSLPQAWSLLMAWVPGLPAANLPSPSCRCWPRFLPSPRQQSTARLVSFRSLLFQEKPRMELLGITAAASEHWEPVFLTGGFSLTFLGLWWRLRGGPAVLLPHEIPFEWDACHPETFYFCCSNGVQMFHHWSLKWKDQKFSFPYFFCFRSNNMSFCTPWGA